ncbi:hypothetical protein HPP92_002470 [Vanilla planifolia]|uniref:rRNA-processing protein UTP23-like protein n=1 Tax=Vanilla planifolia TaxID=51239 RepID=A0A835RTG9_VANPL|nr:hypothetical protein HPP92_002470 [Vanilla planifolia]
MRVKRQKRHRKVVRFYSACFGFREPYKVLCDGTFIHHLLVHGLTPADDSLSHLLGARVLLFTTRCIVSELKSLGESHIEAVEAANQLLMARCDHEKRVSAETCLHSIIGESNSEHFFLATEDCEIRKKFQEAPNPLSCKRKKQNENTTVINNQDTEAGGVRKKKRSRRRKRDHKETTQ